MMKIQEVLLNNMILDGAKELYYRSDKRLEITDDNSVKLYKNDYYDFFTFFNSLPIKDLFEYTITKSFYLILEIKGDISVDIFGHAGKDRGYQKEWISTRSYKTITKKKIEIPIVSVFSEVVSFGIRCNEESYIYDAYYAADADEDMLNLPLIKVLSESSDADNSAKKPQYLMGNILDDSAYKDKFIFDSISEKVKSFSDISSAKYSKSITHVLYIGKNYISEDTLKRLYDFLRIMKKEFRDLCITGAVTDIKRPGVHIGLNYKTENDDSENLFTEQALFSMEGIVDCERSGKISLLDAAEFICAPISIAKKIIYDVTESVRLKGLSVVGSNVKKTFSEQNIPGLTSDLHKLQDVLFDVEKSIEITRHMYYRSGTSIEKHNSDSILMRAASLYDFFTYFNAFSLEKWKKYTHMNSLYLVLDIKGHFDIDLFGHYKNKTGYQKELCGKKHYECTERSDVVIKFPEGMQSSLAGFGIYAHSDLIVYDAYYATDIDKNLLSEPLISMVTTTFKKEEYIQKNIELLSHNLLNDDDYKEHFIWNIIDNGKTLTLSEELSERIRLFPNRNVGGAGGFAKGMIVSLTQKEKPDYILLMDDDVVFIPESFKRLYTLLSMLKDAYKNHFISGAMLKMGEPNIQHEDTGKLIADGYHVAVKPNYDLNLWNNIIDNEVIQEGVEHQYGAWWFCCIPTTVANLDNLPVPVFVRGDDVEYSLRNKAKFITMNGLCIWHEGFEGKFSAALEYYQVNRNELAVRAMHPELNNVDCIGHIKILFWEELYKFNYKGANLLLDAIEDYMKGPEFFKKLDGEKSMKKKREKDYKMKPLTPEIRNLVNFEKLYEYEEIPEKIKKIYDYTYNGQARIPEILIKKKTGVIPYGWGYFPGKMCLTDKNIAIDKTNETYTIFKKNRKKFIRIKNRYENIMSRYFKENEMIEKEYRNAVKDLTGRIFWDEYLSR